MADELAHVGTASSGSATSGVTTPTVPTAGIHIGQAGGIPSARPFLPIPGWGSGRVAGPLPKRAQPLFPNDTPGGTPATLSPGARWRTVRVGTEVIGFVLLRSKRRSIGFMIGDEGLRVTAPRWVTLGDIDAAVTEKSSWILSKLQVWRERRDKIALADTRWEDGGEFPYLGKRLVLRLSAQRTTGLDGNPDAPEDGDALWLGLPADASTIRVRDTVQAWLQAQARRLIGARLDHFLARTGLKINKWRLSSASSRWGSCTSTGNIMLSWRLMHFTVDVIDYVIAHELAHLREMNHSPKFWAQVSLLLPGFEPARDVLRQHDPASLPRFK
jgi:predicted metal-dependent hydrolase